MTNMELYAARIANQLDIIKDRHRDVLMADELNTISAAVNLIYHNRKVLEKE